MRSYREPLASREAPHQLDLDTSSPPGENYNRRHTMSLAQGISGTRLVTLESSDP